MQTSSDDSKGIVEDRGAQRIRREEDVQRQFAQERERKERRRSVMRSAIGQAESDFGTEMRKLRESMTPAEAQQLEALLAPFDEVRLFKTVHAAVMESKRNASSCVLARFAAKDHGEELARQAAHLAAGYINDTEEYKAQVRREGDFFLVKLLDI